MSNVNDFYDRIVSNYSRKPRELISFFVYYLTVEANEPAATAKKIKQCFELCDLTPPARIDSYLLAGTRSKPAKYIKSIAGYRLQRHERADLADKLHNIGENDYTAFVSNDINEEDLSKKPSNQADNISNKKVFIVHGHEKYVREAVARQLEKLGLNPIILSERANGGKTIIEKIESNSDVGFAVVLLTPDDIGGKDKTSLKKRARQNVMLELGYFIGKLGRKNVCSLKYGDVEIPTDFHGVLWEEFDDAGAWKAKLARELSEAGFEVDWKQAAA